MFHGEQNGVADGTRTRDALSPQPGEARSSQESDPLQHPYSPPNHPWIHPQNRPGTRRQTLQQSFPQVLHGLWTSCRFAPKSRVNLTLGGGRWQHRQVTVPLPRAKQKASGSRAGGFRLSGVARQAPREATGLELRLSDAGHPSTGGRSPRRRRAADESTPRHSHPASKFSASRSWPARPTSSASARRRSARRSRRRRRRVQRIQQLRP